jgi:hypothetical protein
MHMEQNLLILPPEKQRILKERHEWTLHIFSMNPNVKGLLGIIQWESILQIKQPS